MARAIIGFEGTGSQDWSQTDLRRAFVHKVVQQGAADYRYYFLGSDNAGQNTEIVVYRALGRAAQLIKEKGVTEINVAGYSRGGLMAVAFADLLKQKFPKVPIPVLTLFDPVDRNMSIKGAQGMTIANNVGFVIRALRDPKYGSRLYMSNCGLWSEAGPNVISCKFPCSHSGAGGLPWDDAFFENGDVMASLASGNPAAAQNKVMALGFAYRGRSKLATFDAPATLDEAADKRGSYQLGYWVWNYLNKRGVVRPGSSPDATLPVLNDMIYSNAKVLDI